MSRIVLLLTVLMLLVAIVPVEAQDPEGQEIPDKVWEPLPHGDQTREYVHDMLNTCKITTLLRSGNPPILLTLEDSLDDLLTEGFEATVIEFATIAGMLDSLPEDGASFFTLDRNLEMIGSGFWSGDTAFLTINSMLCIPQPEIDLSTLAYTESRVGQTLTQVIGLWTAAEPLSREHLASVYQHGLVIYNTDHLPFTLYRENGKLYALSANQVPAAQNELPPNTPFVMWQRDLDKPEGEEIYTYCVWVPVPHELLICDL